MVTALQYGVGNDISMPTDDMGMNIPKLLGIIAVIAFAVFLLYPVVDSAVPKEMDGMPFSVQLGSGSPGVDIDQDNMSFKLVIPDLTISSDMPQDFKDVHVQVFLGSQDKKTPVGSFVVGDVPSKDSKTCTFIPEDVSFMYFFSFLPSLESNEGKLDMPLTISIKFKYMEWRDTCLLDLGLALKIQGTLSNGTATLPEVSVDGKTSTITITPEDGVIKEVAQRVYQEYGSTATVTAGEAVFTLNVTSEGKITVSVSGTFSNAYEALLKMFNETGKLTFVWDSKTFEVEGDQAKAILNAIKVFYPEPEVE